MQQNLVKISKYLSYLLRHKPEAIALELDSEGWAATRVYILASTKYLPNLQLIQVKHLHPINYQDWLKPLYFVCGDRFQLFYLGG